MNKYGCKIHEDVCIEHDEPRLCKHGCGECKCDCQAVFKQLEKDNL